MDYPDQNDAAVDGDSTPAPTFEQQVNLVAGNMTRNEGGNWELPDGELEAPVAHAAMLEKRRRDTASALSKTQHKLKAAEALNAELEKHARSQVTITAEGQAELEELKFSDPDAWYTKKLELETNAQASLDSQLGDYSTTASQQAEIESRSQMLADYNSMHPGALLNDDVLANDLPPRISNKLANGDISFSDFLVEANAYMTKGKVIKTDTPPVTQNLGNAGGSAELLDNSASQSEMDYETQVW